MSAFKATFESSKGRRVMTFQAANQTNAREVAEFFQMTHGRLVKVEAAK